MLVQDLGLVRMIRRIAPDLSIHASTQMSLTSAECINKAQQLGIDRVVLARELSVREIAQIHAADQSVRLEAFVHGALCVAYSGQCLTSESLGGRSANRGQCAQACRLPYELVCDGRDVDLGDQKYLLSPQDLAAYALIPRTDRGRRQCVEDRGTPQDGRVRGQHHAALSRGHRLGQGRCAGDVHAAPGRRDGVVVLARLLRRVAPRVRSQGAGAGHEVRPNAAC